MTETQKKGENDPRVRSKIREDSFPAHPRAVHLHLRVYQVRGNVTFCVILFHANTVISVMFLRAARARLSRLSVISVKPVVKSKETMTHTERAF